MTPEITLTISVIFMIFAVVTTYVGAYMHLKKSKKAVYVLFLSLFLSYVSGFIQNQVLYYYYEKSKECQVDDKK